jgi:putative addiction module killer protein
MSSRMIELRQTPAFATWFGRLRDREAKSRILVRIDRLSLGNPGDVRPVGAGVSELRIDYGPGYRVYFVRRGPALIVLLGGGDKRTQDRDIEAALALARSLQE